LFKKYKLHILALVGYILYLIIREETVTFTMILMIIFSFAFVAWMLEGLDKQNAN
jgi:hypothetical protein